FAAFLAEEAVAGTRLAEFGVERFLRLSVGVGDEIRRALERDLQLFDFAEVALEPTRGFARGGDHHVDQRGVKHRKRVPARRSRVKTVARRWRASALRPPRLSRGRPPSAWRRTDRAPGRCCLRPWRSDAI